MIFRDEEGQVHALDVYCPHLGARREGWWWAIRSAVLGNGVDIEHFNSVHGVPMNGVRLALNSTH